MTFRPEFWLAAATVAPVIVLAVIVATNNLGAMTKGPMLVKGVAVGRSLLSINLRDLRQRYGSGAVPLVVATVMTSVNFYLQGGVLACSLLSLAWGRNVIWPWLVVTAEVASLLLLLNSGSISPRERGDQEEQSRPEQSEAPASADAVDGLTQR